MATDEVRKDLRAAVAARQELGPGRDGVVIVWLGLVGINFARTLGRRNPR
jgi:hypothetical protein